MYLYINALPPPTTPAPDVQAQHPAFGDQLDELATDFGIDVALDDEVTYLVDYYVGDYR